MAGYEDDDVEFGDLQGYANLDPGNDNSDGDEDYDDFTIEPFLKKQKRPAHYSRSTRAAERSAMRTQVEAAESFLLDETVEDQDENRPRRIPGTFGRRVRPKGDSLAAPYRKVNAEQLDSDDDMIMQMRSQGFTDGQICDKLAREGRIRYDRKTISSRVSRIRHAQGEHTDFLLEEGYKEWSHEDDQRLMQAYEYANIEILYEIERTRAWRFKKVSDYMRRLAPDSPIYSEKACKERYIGLINGTASIPLEMHDDPDSRRAEMEAFREEREAARAIQHAEQEKKEELDRKIKEEVRARQAAKAEQTAVERARRAEEKAQQHAAKEAAKQEKLRKAAEKEAQKAQRLAEFHNRGKAARIEADNKARMQNKNASLPLNTVADLKSITADTPDPRANLSMEDLSGLCQQRGLSGSARNKEELLARLRDADEQRTLAQLKTMCRMKGLNIAGTKVQMKYQLAMAEASKCASYGVQQDGNEGVEDEDGGEEDEEMDDFTV